jgi:hypothetical protein
MAEEVLPNANISQHPPGEPEEGDYFLFYKKSLEKTMRCNVDPFLPSGTTNNFEWTSANAALGVYDIGSVVTRAGDWYQSTVNNNASAPGVVPGEWMLLTKGKTWQLWAASVFTEDFVVVLRKIDGRTYCYSLDDAVVRPFVSSDFDVEITAGQWKQFGQRQRFILDNSDLGSVDLVLNKLESLSIETNTNIVDNRVWTIDEHEQTQHFVVLFDCDSGAVQTLPAVFKLSDTDNAEYNPGTKTWAPLESGAYKLVADRKGDDFLVTIHGPSK